MKRILYILLPALLAAGSCKKSSDDDSETPKYTSSTSTVLVSSFALNPNLKVLNHLDSVHFTIDTERMMIYNADSLPKGTDVSRLQVTLKFGSAVSSAVFNIPNRVETITYRTTMTDSLDFSQGPVTLTVTSADAKNSADYKIMVNVHRVDPDSIAWQIAAIDAFGIEEGAEVTSALTDDGYVALVNDGTDAFLARTESLVSPSWQLKEVTLPAASVRDLTALESSLYCLGSDIETDPETATLLRSDDGGETWSDTGKRWRTIIGTYDGFLLGVARGADLGDQYEAAAHYSVVYPSEEVTKLPADFPVEGMSAPVPMTSTWSTTSYVMIAGGVKADGGHTGAVWAFDGDDWGLLSTSAKTLPPVRDMCMVPYWTYTVNANNYSAKRGSALYAFGGFYTDGAYNTEVYVSTDNGLNWTVAGSKLQIPAALNVHHFSGKAYVESQSMSRNQAPRRGVAPSVPVTTWDCPRIYAIGSDKSGAPMLLDGVYTRLMFVPIY